MDDQSSSRYWSGKAQWKNVLLPEDMIYAEWKDWQLARAPADIKGYLHNNLKDGTITLQNTLS